MVFSAMSKEVKWVTQSCLQDLLSSSSFPAMSVLSSGFSSGPESTNKNL